MFKNKFTKILLSVAAIAALGLGAVGLYYPQQAAPQEQNDPTFGSLLRRMEIDGPLSAFGEVLTAEIYPIVQSSFEYTVNNTELITTSTAGSGTVTQSQAMGVVNTGATTGSVAEIRSRTGARYRAGIGSSMRFTALFTTGVAGTSQWAGLMDEAGSTADFMNGFAIGYSGDTFGIARFQNDTLNFTSVSSCEDPLDGSGASGMTIDTTKLNVFEIKFQYLGAGSIKYFIEDPEDDGRFFKFCEIKYANNNTVPSIFNPNFFPRFKVDNKATTADLTMKMGSFGYFTEGRSEYYQLHQPQFSTGIVTKTGVTTETALFTIRNKSTYQSKTNAIQVLLERVALGVEASSPNNLAQWRIVKDATLGGTPSFTDINTSDSVVDYDTAGTTLTGGKTILSGTLAGKNDESFENLEDYKIILSPGEQMTFAISSANSAEFRGSILWKELF